MEADFIVSQRIAHADLSAEYGQLEELYSRRLYHQLTEALYAFVSDPKSNRGDNLIQLYEKFIVSFESKLNQLKLIRIVSRIAEQFYPTRPYVPEEIDRAIGLLDLQAVRRAKTGSDRLTDDAFFMVRMEIASLKLKRAAGLAARSTTPAGAAASGGASSSSSASAAASSGTAAAAPVDESTRLLDEVKADIYEGAEELHRLGEGLDPLVPAAYYGACSDYYRLRGPAAEFYKHALLYLGHTPLASLTPEAKAGWALEIAVAALVGEGVYNFGEVNSHAILQSLAGTGNAWLVDLLKTFQTGDIDAFNAVLAAHRGAYEALPALAARSATVKEKITLLAIMELAARKPAGERVLTFAEIAAETKLPVDKVEWVVMRALSLGLLRGTIDEVASTVEVSFVKPRVLDTAQIAALKERIDAWRDKARTTMMFVEEHTRDVFA